MNESFRIGAALLLKTLYKNVALVKCHLVSKFSQSRVLILLIVVKPYIDIHEKFHLLNVEQNVSKTFLYS
jgi:hypothetical protein